MLTPETRKDALATIAHELNTKLARSVSRREHLLAQQSTLTGLCGDCTHCGIESRGTQVIIHCDQGRSPVGLYVGKDPFDLMASPPTCDRRETV